jgi:hypothetical protein
VRYKNFCSVRRTTSSGSDLSVTAESAETAEFLDGFTHWYVFITTRLHLVGSAHHGLRQCPRKPMRGLPEILRAPR